MNSYTKRHRIWLKAIATVVVCLFVFNDLAYPLSAYTRFKPLIITEGKGFKEDAGFLYLSNLIGQALNIERKINGEITPEVIKMLTKKHLRAIDFTRFKWKELYREGKAFCLPYVRKEDGGTQILKYFHPDDISAEFPHKILFQFEDGTKVILEDPLKDEGEGSSEFSLELDQMAADIAAGRFDDIAAGRDEKFKRVPDEELPPRIKKGMGKPSLTIRGVYEYTGGKLGLRVLKKGVRNIDVLKGFFRTRSRWRCPTFFRDHDDEHVYELDLLPLGYRNLKDIAGEYAENLPSGWREKIRQAIASALRRDGEWFGHGHMHSGNIMVKTDEAGDLVDIKLIDWKQLRRQKIREELKEFIEGSRQSLEGLYFEGFALEGFDFRGRNLTSASFLACNLNWADFRGANLELARMKFSDSRNADFTGARFSGSDLEATMFGGADLTDADLKNCNLRGSIFTGANLEGTDLRGSFLDGADFKTALMKNTKFDKYMGEKLEKYRFQVKYIEDYCEATSPDLDVTRLERLVRDAAIGSIPEFRAKQVAGYFLPYKEMDDDFLIKAIRKCLYEDPYFSISNFDLESKEREALREGIPLIVNEARDEVVVKTYGIGRRAIDLQQVVKMLIDHLEECGKKINIRLIGYDISERSLDFSRYPMKIFIESLPAAWRERISYEVYYGDLKERKCWPMMTVDPLADISIKRHTWIHLEGRESGNTKDERDLEDAIEEGLNTPGVLIVNEAVRMELKVKKAEITDILRRVVLETRDEWEDLGACQVHSQEIVRRLTKEGISAYVAKNDSVRHWWVETEGYVIDAFPEGARGDYKKAARDLGDERFVIVRKSSEVAKRLYQGVEDKKKTAEAKKDAEDDIAFYIRLREHFDNVLRRKGIRLFAVKKKAFIDKVTERLARIEEKLRQLQEGSDADVGVAPFDGTPPPGSPATLLRYMFGYNFKKEKYEAGKAINKKRAKRVVQLVGKRGGNDSPSTVSIEMRVLREAGLIESYRVNKSGQIFYFLPEWALELDPEEILAKVPEFEETNPIAKISKIKRKITHLKRKVVKEAGLSESEEGEAVINTETHSAGMKDRPVMSIRTTLWKVYQMFPDLKITFKWRKSQISITEAPSISDFSPLRDISYKGKMKIIIAGPYAKGTLNKIAALVEKLIHEEKFMQGFSPDGRVIEIGYSIYSGAMLKNEIDTDIKALGMSSTNFGWPKSPPGNPMTLLQYMFGYDFKEGRFVPENLTGRNNPKKSADMVDKRGGKDSPATIRLEVKVLREAGLIEGSGRKGYYIPEWVIEYGLDRVMAEIEELNVPKPKEKQMEAIKDKVDRIKAQISMEEAGTAKFKGPEKKKKKDPAERRVELAKKLKDLKAKLPKGIEATVDVLAEVSEGKLTPQQILNEAKELGIDLAVLGIATKAMPEREKWMRRLRALLLKLPKGAEPTERALAKASKGALTGKQIGEVLHDHNITLGEIGAAGMNEVVLEAETHSGGIHHRPTEALVYICVRLQDILPVAEIIFIGSDETVRIKNPRTTAACFDPLRRLGEKEKGRYVYRGKIKIIVSGAYPEGELKKAASILQVLIKDERFTYGIEPDVYTEGPDGKQYTGEMLKIEIDKKLNELEALKKSRLADLATKTQLLDTTIPKTLADLEREMRINNRCITFYWKEMSGHSKLRPGNELRQALTEVTSIGDELDQLLNVVQTRRDTGKGMNVGSRKEIFDLVREINESASGFHFAITYLLMSGPKSYVAQNLVSKLENIMEICGQILPGEGAEEREEEEFEEEEAPVIPQKVSKEPEASRRKRDEALPPIRDELVSAKFTLVDILTSAELFVDKDRETELVRDVISTENKKFLKELISLLEDLKKNREKITKNILIEAGEIRKAAERCREPFETIIKVSSSAGVGKGNIFYIRLVKMAEMLAKIKALCDDIAPPKKKAPPDGAPYSIFNKLQIKFKGRYATTEEVRKLTKGRYKDGHLSPDVVEEDLKTLVFLGLVKRSDDGKRYKALDLSPSEWEEVSRVLLSLGSRPKKTQKEAAAKKLAEMFSRKARESALAEETPVEKDIREYSLKYGSDDPFMILGVALTKVNWPVVRYYVYYLSDLVKKGRPMSVLQEHILLRAEHALKEYRKKVQALDDWVRDEGKPPAEGSPAKCIGTLFLNENLRKKTDISVRKDLLPERKKEKPNIVRQTVQKEVEMLVKLGILVEGTKPHTYQLRPELQNLPPPEGNELPKVLKKICEVRHEGIGWLGRPKIPQEIIPIIRSKIESCITTEKAITVRSPGGISEEQALAIKKIADSLWDKWKISVFIGRDDGTGTCSATDVSGMCGLGIKNRENVKVAVKGFHDEKMMGKAMNIIEGLLHNPYALLYYTVDPRLHESYFKAVEKLSEVPHFKTSFECGHDVFYGDSAWYQALLKRLEGYGIKHTVTVKRKNLVTIELEGGRSEQQLRQVAAFMRKVLEERPSDHFSAHDPLDREKRAFVLVVHNMLPAILGGEIKFDFPKKEMEGSEKHPFFPNEKLSWTVNPKVGNIAFTLGQSAWGRYEIFVTKDGKKVYVAPYLEDITPRTPVEYFSMDISDPRLLAGSLAYHYDGKQVLLGEMLPGASLGPEDKINRNRIVGVLVEALSLRIEMTKRPNLNYYFMIDRVHGDENMDIVSRNVLETGELPHTIGVVEKGTPIPDFYATDQDRRLALLVEAGAYTPEQLAEKLFNGYWNLCKSLDVANELVLGLSIRGVKKPGEFGKKARRLANLFLLQLEYKRRKGEEVKLPETITVEDAYRNMRVTYRVDPEILKTDKPSSVKRYDDISRIANLHEFMFRSEKILDERKRKDEQKKKTKRVKELFGENVVAGELDLDPDFHRVIEELRRAEFLRGNEGGVEILNWVPHTIMLSALLECTARCAHCLEASAPKRPEKMSFSDIGRALDTRDIAVNSPVATIVGGEILLRKDLIEIISRYPIYALTTNASEMDTPKIAREFVIALKDAFEKRRNVMAKGFLISESKLRECQDDPYLMHWANYTRDRDFELSRRQSDDFSIYISLDNLHMAQRRISADKICNLVEAIIDHYPKAKLGFIALEKNWEKALDNVEKKFRDRGFSFSYDPKKSRYIVSRKSDGQTKVISITTEDISRQGRALYLPDRYFSEINMESDIEKAIKEFHPPRLARVTLNYEGRLTVFDSWISEHGPLFFGNVIREGWDTVLKRLDKDPLFRVISGFPQDKLDLRYVLEIANEYEPGIVEKILEGKPGDLGAFVYWLFSNPERKLYITYRLLNEYYEKGILKGESPHAGMSNDEIKVLVKEQVAELRTEFVRRKKIDFIDKYYRTRKGLTKSKSAEGRAFLPSGTDDVVLVAERFLRGKPEARVLDLGAGNAKALSILSLYARVTGDEIDPELFAEGKTCIDEFSRHGIVDKSRIDLTQRDFLKTEKGEFSRYDLIYTYWPFSIWGSEEGERLKKRLLEEMDPDAILVVNRASRDLHEDLSAEFEEVEFPGEEEDSHPRLRAYCLRRESYATGYEGTGFGREGAEGTTAKEEAPKKVDTEQKEPARLDLRSLIDERISKTFKYRRSTELIKKLPENIYVTIQPSAWLEQGGKKKDFIKEWRTELILILDELFTNALEGRSGDFRDLVSEEVSRVRIEAKIEDGSIVFTVEDDAPGIPEEGMKNVKLLSEDKPLDPDASTKGRPGGFGLAVTLPMAKYVGGDIEIKTRRKEDYKYKKGTTACLRIPAEVVHIPSDEEVKSANMLEKIKIEERDSGIDWEKGIVKDFCDIVMARLLETADKEQKQNIIIGVDTSWIPFDQNSGKVDALLREVKKKFKLLTKMNAGEVMIVSESGDKLAERIDAVANDEKTKTDYSNVAILGSSVTLNSTEFDKFADEALLIEVEADYFSLEMFTLALKMLAGYPDPETHDIAVIQDEKKGPRYYYFKAEPVDPDELVDKYELQTRLLEKHA